MTLTLKQATRRFGIWSLIPTAYFRTPFVLFGYGGEAINMWGHKK